LNKLPICFLKRLDEQETAEELKANREKKSMQKRFFPDGKDRKKRPQDYRWNRFKNTDPRDMYAVVSEHVFPWLRTLGGNTAVPIFGAFADRWLSGYARVECKTSTADGYEGVLRQYLRPRFATKPLNQIRSDDVKALINELVTKDLSRNTVRNALCVIRGIFNEAIEDGIVEVNPAARPGRFTRIAKIAEVKGISLTRAETGQFLQAAKEICPEYHPLFLMALRAGLRRGELVAVQWGDLQFGKDEQDANRFIDVQRNYVRREHTTTKSKKSRRVDLSQELRRVLIELRDRRLLEAFLEVRTTSPTSSCSHRRTGRFWILTTSTTATFSQCSLSPGSGRSGSMI